MKIAVRTGAFYPEGLRCRGVNVGYRSTIAGMAKLALVYGLRLLPAEEVAELGEASVKLKNGREAHVTMHLLEGSKEQIEKQLRTSVEAFFDIYPEI
jgi:hypothetical protein